MVEIAERTRLSTRGATRSTAYGMSNKIVRRGDRLFVTWLDHVSDIRVRMLDLATGRWGDTVTVGKGVDNHSGPALTMDAAGYLHIVYGTHHHPFKYQRSVRPADIGEWTPVETFGEKGTYPSLVASPAGSLWCACRSSRTDPWRLRLFHCPAAGAWDAGRDLLDVGVKGYAWLGNSLAVAADGTLHLGFVIYDTHPKGGKAAGYLRSNDNGATWTTAAGRRMTLPVSPESECFIEQGPALDMRVPTLVLDPDGKPWMVVQHYETQPRTVVLWHHDGTTWHRIDLLPFLQQSMPEWELVAATMTVAADGDLYVAATVQPARGPQQGPFGTPGSEIVLLVSSDGGKNFKVLPISEPDPEEPNWLPSIERPYGAAAIGVPALLYTHGGPGVGCREGDATETWFVRLRRK